MIPRFLNLWGPVLLVAGGVAFFSHMSAPPGIKLLSDWNLHALEFTLLGVAVARALAGGLGRPLVWRTAVLAFVVTVVYGAADELHQAFVPRRVPAFDDWVADAAGTASGVAIAFAASRLRPGARRSPVPKLPVTLVTGPHCALCDEARATLDRLGRRLPLQVEERSISEDQKLAALYAEEIPVVLVSGLRVAGGKINGERLEASLAARLETVS